ncbi:MAG: hypothetical protein Fur0035_03860 [Anaerolineales bacterium]
MKTAWWKDFLFVPDLSEGELKLYRRWLLIILPVALTLLALYYLVALRTAPNRDALIFVGIFALMLPGLFFLAWHNHVNAASAILSLGSFIGLLAATIRFGGVRSASYPTVLVSILLASMFLRARVAVTMGIVATAAGVILLIGESAGWYRPDFVIASPFSTWFNVTLLFLVCAALLGLAGKNIRTILFNFRNEIRERLRAETALRESSEYLTALHATTLDIINRRELLPLLESILTQAEQLVQTENGYLDIVIQENALSEERVGHGLFANDVGEITPFGEGLTGQAFMRRATVRVRDYNAWEFHRAKYESANFRAVMAVPLLAQDRPLGVIGLAYTEARREFSDEQVRRVEQFAELAALALDNALLLQAEQEKLQERQRAESELRESQERLNLALRAANMGLWSWNVASGAVSWSDEVYRVFGLEAAEFDGKFESYLEAIHPADRERVVKKIEQALRGEAEEYHVEHRLLDKNGKIRWLEGRGQVTRDANGAPLTMSGTVWDITEQKRAEQALRRADASLERNAAALQRRSTLLQVGSEVSRAASAILDSQRLAQQVVKLVQTRFHLYYVGLFLVDESGAWAALRAATGPAGRKMLTQKHRLPVAETSMVGWAILNRQARIALDVGEEAVRFNNPLLPETRSEIALPLISRGQALGAISIQSSQEAAFSREDISSFQTMTDQLANAILNARLYDQIQRELEERKAIEEEIRRLNSELEQRVQERTADLRASEEKFRALTENNPLRIRRYDREGRYLYANHISGDPHFRTPDLIGRKIREVVEDPSLVELAERCIAQVFESGQPLNTEYKIREAYASWWLAPEFDDDGNVISVITSTLDITERRRMEEELRQRSAELQTANRELEAFSYSVSHDLRAPLRAIDGFSRIVSEDFAPLLPAEGRELLERIRRAAQEMGTLIDDLLRLSRVTRAELRQENVDLAALAAEICAELNARQPEKNVRFFIAEKLEAQGDARLLRVALENLLNNAWKFSGKNETPRIEIGRDPQQNAFFVRDNGVGFDMAYADKLFGAFQRLHSADEFPGTGIGLAIVQRVIHRHSGKVWAQSQPGQGATFYFTLGA